MAKSGPTGDHSHVSTQVMGTQGYTAPEYLTTGLFIFNQVKISSCAIALFIKFLIALLIIRVGHMILKVYKKCEYYRLLV